jgi:ATP-dependent DNA helicase PIF1
MDYIEWFYSKNFPVDEYGLFGGKQIIMVGDLDQLPPVVASDDERKFLNARFGNEFFFSARCWQEQKFRTIKLTKIWRQNDPVFIELLNRVKNNKLTGEDIEFINQKCFRTEIKPSDGIILSATNEIAQNINYKMLMRSPGEIHKFDAVIEGEFKTKNAPVEPCIELKIGARVMLAVNDSDKPRRYVNGSMGILKKVNYPSADDIIDNVPTLEIELDGGPVITVGQAVFEQKQFIYNEEDKSIKDKVTASFTQYPVKLAYAITIHKSQGLTFDKVIIDLGRGAFAHGQVYVALSRCRSLEGVTLRVPLKAEDLVYNDVVLDFNAKFAAL